MKILSITLISFDQNFSAEKFVCLGLVVRVFGGGGILLGKYFFLSSLLV
jgi:hypothetical protein